jgi:glutamate dehydrogenase
MECIGIKEFNAKGELTGEKRFLGLFTSRAFSTPIDQIPILRRKLRKILELERAKEGSHDFKQTLEILDSFPIGELFWIEPADLHRDVRRIMNTERERGVRLVIRLDPSRRGFSVMVIMPREKFNSTVRQRIQDYLAETLHATHVDYRLAMTEDDESQARFHFFFSSSLDYDDIRFSELEKKVAELSKSWDDALEEELAKRFDSRGHELAKKYSRLFSDGYKAEVEITNAIVDVENLESLGEKPFGVDLINPAETRYPESTTRLRIYHVGSLSLARFFPVLENLGLRVFEQINYILNKEDPHQSSNQCVDIFRVQDSSGSRINIERDGDRLKDALLAVLAGEVTDDTLNHLVLGAGLTARQVALLRTYRGYLFQLVPSASLTFVTRTMVNNPNCSAILYDYFRAKFAPEIEGRNEAVQKAQDAFVSCLQSVSSLPEDEILRFTFSLIEATTRTNFYLGKPYIGVKVQSQDLVAIPEPRPFREIFVSSPEVEAIHLRGGRISRGGLRWSDRPDDFRTEVLGLMKTQMTKNTLIVPEGSKGGFVLKRPPADPAALKAHVREQYRVFIRGLLDLTDNIQDGEPVHPANLVIYDDPDPYLVVAADKGTATFSDTANEVSAEYQFWLGDAFASGGSHGYDHKKEGITANGAWECAKRHFRELGIDPMTEEFTAIGIGDMSGDVFGNGMLYTKKTKLLAAFNHQHIFFDPDPDSQVSFKERERLFHDPSLSWLDYRPGLISEGGGVFSRNAKSIELSPQIQECLRVKEQEISGEDLVHQILQMEVDLLWIGGIGTYVKASTERNSDVGDPNNDRVRIDASDLKARIIAEGGNLALTQLARIEFALNGGHINTDAVDNSGGVDMSDHEVNIKILLKPDLDTGTLGIVDRNELLERMTAEVNQLVLRNNYRQALGLSMAARLGPGGINQFESLQRYLTHKGGLKPTVEFLPGREELKRRLRQKRGYTRPELAVLTAYTKMGLKRALRSSPISEEPVLEHYLRDYFPALLTERAKDNLVKHPLKREIVATQLTNCLVDRLGLGFLHRVIQNTGATANEAMRAVIATHEILNLGYLFDEIFFQDKHLKIETQYRAIDEIVASVEGIVDWLLMSGANITDLSSFVTTYRAPLAELRASLSELLPVKKDQKLFLQKQEDAIGAGYSKEFSSVLSSAAYLPSCMSVIDINLTTGRDLHSSAVDFYAIGDVLALGRLREGLEQVGTAHHLEAVARKGLITDLRLVQRQLTIAYLHRQETESLTAKQFLQTQTQLMRRIRRLTKEVLRTPEFGVSGTSVLTRLLFQLVKELEA